MATPSPSSPPSRARGRRFLLAAVFVYLAWLGWARMQQAQLDGSLLMTLGARPGLLYLTISGVVWGVLGLAAAAAIYLPFPWTRWSVPAAALLFAASYWADFLFLTRAAEMRVNWPFALGLTLAGLGYCAWVAGSLPAPRR